MEFWYERGVKPRQRCIFKDAKGSPKTRAAEFLLPSGKISFRYCLEISKTSLKEYSRYSNCREVDGPLQMQIQFWCFGGKQSEKEPSGRP